MATAGLSVDQARCMILHVCDRLIASKDVLTQADKSIGDGDHGIGMARGFSAVRQKLEAAHCESLSELFQRIGSTLLTSVGGASGAIFGCFFSGAARGLADCATFDAKALSVMLISGFQEVRTRGKAAVGDKTMLDALNPAVVISAEMASAPLYDSLSAAAKAACDGMEATKTMIARTGKAKTLGERSLGHADPGAISVHLILQAMSEYAQTLVCKDET